MLPPQTNENTINIMELWKQFIQRASGTFLWLITLRVVHALVVGGIVRFRDWNKRRCWGRYTHEVIKVGNKALDSGESSDLFVQLVAEGCIINLWLVLTECYDVLGGVNIEMIFCFVGFKEHCFRMVFPVFQRPIWIYNDGAERCHFLMISTTDLWKFLKSPWVG